MKFYKYFALLIFYLIVTLSCNPLFVKNNNKEFSVFSNDAILADQNYYTKAVMEYYLVNLVLNKFGKIEIGFSNPNNLLDTTSEMNIQTISVPEPLNIACQYKRPEKITDLESGFQYRYYLFSGDTKASMQAFGITDVSATKETTYMIIDYLQFKDCKCPELPSIRYAVGLRSELKINSIKSSFEFKGAQSLKNLAAQVELDQAEVFFSLRTIGITGLEARLNIPQGVSFDVTTYKDFQNAIEFVKNKIDNGKVFISPEIIPVMDDYRPNFRSTLKPMINEIVVLSDRKREINKSKKLDSLSIVRLTQLIDKEINNIIFEREAFDTLYNSLYSPNKLLAITNDIPRSEIYDVRNPQPLLKFDDVVGTVKNEKSSYTSSLKGAIEAINSQNPKDENLYPNLSKLDSNKLDSLGQYYSLSYKISSDDFVKFLKHLNNDAIDNDKLSTILKIFKSRDVAEINNRMLEDVILFDIEDKDLSALIKPTELDSIK